MRTIRNYRKNIENESRDSTTQLIPVSATVKQYKLTTRAANQLNNKLSNTNNCNISRPSVTVNNNLVSIES